MIKNYPISEQDQAKLFRAGYILVHADTATKKITLVDPDGGTVAYQFPSKRAVANFVAEAALTRGTIVNQAESIHKTSKNRLLCDDWRFVRFSLLHREITAQTAKKGWHKIQDIPEGVDIIEAFQELLKDNKTIHL